MNENILVTGGAGFIGSILSNFLYQKKFKIYVIDSLNTGNKSNLNKKIKFLKSNLNNIKKINSFLRKNNINTIFHFAAIITPPRNKTDKKKLINTNILQTKKLLKALNKTNVEKFIFSSSAAVYGNKRNTVKENTQLKPINTYGVSKKEGELLIEKYCKKLNIKFANLRFFNVIGADKKYKITPNNNYNSLKNNLFNSLINKKKFFIFCKNKKKTPVRDYIHVLDVIHICYRIFLLLSEKKSILINVGRGISVNIISFVKIFEMISKSKIIKKYKKISDNEIFFSVANNHKLKKMKLIKKFRSLKVMIKDITGLKKIYYN